MQEFRMLECRNSELRKKGNHNVHYDLYKVHKEKIHCGHCADMVFIVVKKC
jgi:hypothetical protein